MTTPMWYDKPLDYEGSVAIGPPPPPPAGDGGGTVALQPIGAQRLTTTSTKAPDTGSGWANFATGLKSLTDALAPIAKTGLEYQAMRDDRKLAQQQATQATQRSVLEMQVAQSNLNLARNQQQAALAQRSAAPAPTPGMSGTTIALIVGGVAAVGVLVMAMAKKK